jgi:hypothetical protein
MNRKIREGKASTIRRFHTRPASGHTTVLAFGFSTVQIPVSPRKSTNTAQKQNERNVERGAEGEGCADVLPSVARGSWCARLGADQHNNGGSGMPPLTPSIVLWTMSTAQQHRTAKDCAHRLPFWWPLARPDQGNRITKHVRARRLQRMDGCLDGRDEVFFGGQGELSINPCPCINLCTTESLNPSRKPSKLAGRQAGCSIG